MNIDISIGMSKAWCFTLNNPEILPVFGKEVVYAIYQKEKGDNGTEHFQGYMELATRHRLGGVKKILPRAHLEQRKGSRDAAREYCRKEETRIEGPYEHGTWVPSQQGRRSDLEEMLQMVKDGKREIEIADAIPGTWARNYKALSRYRFLLDKSLTEFRKLLVEVYCGTPGTGKTRKAVEENYGSFFKLDMGNQVWFDGYEGETCLIIDDFYGWIPYGFLLNLLDGYPLRLPIKGNHTWARWTKVVITSNRQVEEWYIGREISALLRRINLIKNF